MSSATRLIDGPALRQSAKPARSLARILRGGPAIITFAMSVSRPAFALTPAKCRRSSGSAPGTSKIIQLPAGGLPRSRPPLACALCLWFNYESPWHKARPNPKPRNMARAGLPVPVNAGGPMALPYRPEMAFAKDNGSNLPRASPNSLSTPAHRSSSKAPLPLSSSPPGTHPSPWHA